MPSKIIFILFIFIVIDVPLLLFSDSHNNEKIDTITVNPGFSDTTNDVTFGNKWYSRQNLYLSNSLDMGFTGTRDYLTELFFSRYTFRSKIKHAFALRSFHIGFAPGTFSNHFTIYHFNVLIGFEYLYKIFSNKAGLFLWMDVGASNRGFAFNLGLGIGERTANGLEFWVSYLADNALFSRLEFYFLIKKLLILRGKLGVDMTFRKSKFDMFTFLNGFFIGVFIKKVFKIELGGGFTFNDRNFLNGFGGVNIAFNFDF